MFSDKLRELRTSKGISQVELANHLGVAQQTVGKWEKNIAMPGVDTLETVADYFGQHRLPIRPLGTCISQQKKTPRQSYPHLQQGHDAK